MSASPFKAGGVRLPRLRLPRARHPGVLRYSAAHFLGALVLLLIASPFLESFEYAKPAELLLFTLVMSSAVLAVGARRRTLFWAVALVTPALLARWVNHLMPDTAPPEIFLIAALLFLAFVAVHLFNYILRAPRVNPEVLCAGIAAYIMLALVWSEAYALVDRLQPGAFAFSQGADAGRPMRGFAALYFSFVTLSTVGYGDITPVSNVARMLAMLEAATGVFYVAILVARLVSLYSAAELVALENPSPAAGAPPRDKANGAPADTAGELGRVRTAGEQQPAGVHSAGAAPS